MPYVSHAQARKFHSTPKLRKYTAEYDAATNFTHLPERVPQKGRHRMTRAHHKARHTAITAMLAAGGNRKQ